MYATQACTYFSCLFTPISVLHVIKERMYIFYVHENRMRSGTRINLEYILMAK